mmetsp:Transcript_66385/g.163590  ORF Transcript_66385/g.163590 Transcript_66385/m.163590 type:complete len:424 (-) Transcript_66385:475-1746(-)
MPRDLLDRLHVRDCHEPALLPLALVRVLPRHKVLLSFGRSLGIRGGLPPALYQLVDGVLLEIAKVCFEEHNVGSRRGGNDAEVGVWVPRHARDGLPDVPHTQAAPRAHLPHAHGPILGARHQENSRGLDGDGVDPARVAQELDREGCGEGPEVLGLGQLGQERLGVNVHPLLHSAGAQIEVEAPLKTLVQDAGVVRDLSEGVVLAGEEVHRPVLHVLLEQLLLLLLGQEVLLGRVVRLGVARELWLGGGDGHGPTPLDVHFGVPQVVVVELRALLVLLGALQLARADQADVLNHGLGLVLRRHKTRLGLGPAEERVDLVLGVVDGVGVVRIRVVARVELSGPQAPEQLELVVSKAQLLVVDLVVHVAPRLRVIGLGEVRVERVLARLPDDLLPAEVVADVLLVAVPLHGDVADGVAHEGAVLI